MRDFLIAVAGLVIDKDGCCRGRCSEVASIDLCTWLFAVRTDLPFDDSSGRVFRPQSTTIEFAALLTFSSV